MHDPSTVAFEIRYPWPWPRQHWPRGRKGPRATFLTIWHDDPEKGGDEDSCDWSGRHLTDAEVTAARRLWTNETDNLRPYLKDLHEYDRDLLLFAQWRRARQYYRPRPWYQHPRWHIWHWRLQIHPIQHLKRWAWSRCATCGGRFRWGESCISGNWDSTGPRWFRGEANIWHIRCDRGVAR